MDSWQDTPLLMLPGNHDQVCLGGNGVKRKGRELWGDVWGCCEGFEGLGGVWRVWQCAGRGVVLGGQEGMEMLHLLCVCIGLAFACRHTPRPASTASIAAAGGSQRPPPRTASRCCCRPMRTRVHRTHTVQVSVMLTASGCSCLFQHTHAWLLWMHGGVGGLTIFDKGWVLS